jgi:hypothetical protein
MRRGNSLARWFYDAREIRELTVRSESADGKEARIMQYIVWPVPRQPTPAEQARARAEFWDAVQKLSMLVGLVVAIRSLKK